MSRPSHFSFDSRRAEVPADSTDANVYEVKGNVRYAMVVILPLFLVGIAAAAGSGGDLKCTFKMADVASNRPIRVSCAAKGEAVYGCFEKSGAASKHKVEGAPVSAFAEFTSGADGIIAGVVVVAPPASDLVCSEGEERRLCSVRYSAIQLTSSGAAAADVPGTVNHVLNNCGGEDRRQAAPSEVSLPRPGK